MWTPASKIGILHAEKVDHVTAYTQMTETEVSNQASISTYFRTMLFLLMPNVREIVVHFLFLGAQELWSSLLHSSSGITCPVL